MIFSMPDTALRDVGRFACRGNSGIKMARRLFVNWSEAKHSIFFGASRTMPSQNYEPALSLAHTCFICARGKFASRAKAIRERREFHLAKRFALAFLV